MRKDFKYRLIGNGHYELHTIEEFAGEYIGINDVNYVPIFEGDRIKGFDEMLKETLVGVVTYIAPVFTLQTKDGYSQSLENIMNIEKI